MGRSYKQCNGCGKQALSIATRCPACGCERLTRVDPEPARPPGRFRSPGVGAGILVAAAVLTVAWLGQGSGAPAERPPAVAVKPTAFSEVAYAMAAPTGLDSASLTALPPEGAGEPLVARTWTSVRTSRSRIADLEAVLLPGDTVVADSLERGWYRVALEGEILGYVHRSTLTPPPSPAASASTDRPATLPQAPPRPSPH